MASNGDLHYIITQIKGYFSEKVDRSEIGAAASQAVANNLTTTAAGSVLDARQGKLLNDSLDNLFPGGSNILRNTNTSTALTSSSAWSAGTWNAYNTNGTTAIVQYTAGEAPNPDITFGHRVTLTGTACSYAQRDVPLLSGQEYTMSAYVRLISGEGNLLLRAQGTANQTKRFVATSDWAKVTFTFTADGSAHIVFLNDTAVGVIDFCGEKLELGNKATDWSLSPWDVGSVPSAAARSGYTILPGGLKMCWGLISITPSAANQPTSAAVTFPITFDYIPMVVPIERTSSPGVISLGVGVSGESTTGCNIWYTRSNTTALNVGWMAIGR